MFGYNRDDFDGYIRGGDRRLGTIQQFRTGGVGIFRTFLLCCGCEGSGKERLQTCYSGFISIIGFGYNDNGGREPWTRKNYLIE